MWEDVLEPGLHSGMLVQASLLITDLQSIYKLQALDCSMDLRRDYHCTDTPSLSD